MKSIDKLKKELEELTSTLNSLDKKFYSEWEKFTSTDPQKKFSQSSQEDMLAIPMDKIYELREVWDDAEEAFKRVKDDIQRIESKSEKPSF